ncbi:MAG: VPLPA-CTERM sorting domain-containing protein [Gammaproteobacteria bacterium]|nr:VPLPA-CTERM sorting domain-containing protein [Gammaproteobacteria bacterium]
MDYSNALDDGIDYLTVKISDSMDIEGAIDFEVNVIVEAFPEPGSNFGLQSFYFNYDDSLDVTKSNFVGLDPSSWGVTENRNPGGNFGKFDFRLGGKGNSRTETLRFTIDGVDGDTIDSYAVESFLKSGTGQFFAAHVAGFSNDPYGVTSAKFGGSELIDESRPPSAVPVPAAVWLFGSALSLLAFIRRRWTGMV